MLKHSCSCIEPQKYRPHEGTRQFLRECGRRSICSNRPGSENNRFTRGGGRDARMVFPYPFQGEADTTPAGSLRKTTRLSAVLIGGLSDPIHPGDGRLSGEKPRQRKARWPPEKISAKAGDAAPTGGGHPTGMRAARVGWPGVIREHPALDRSARYPARRAWLHRGRRRHGGRAPRSCRPRRGRARRRC